MTSRTITEVSSVRLAVESMSYPQRSSDKTIKMGIWKLTVSRWVGCSVHADRHNPAGSELQTKEHHYSKRQENVTDSIQHKPTEI
jgi:hypothetical protein